MCRRKSEAPSIGSLGSSYKRDSEQMDAAGESEKQVEKKSEVKNTQNLPACHNSHRIGPDQMHCRDHF